VSSNSSPKETSNLLDELATIGLFGLVAGLTHLSGVFNPTLPLDVAFGPPITNLAWWFTPAGLAMLPWSIPAWADPLATAGLGALGAFTFWANDRASPSLSVASLLIPFVVLALGLPLLSLSPAATVIGTLPLAAALAAALIAALSLVLLPLAILAALVVSLALLVMALLLLFTAHHQRMVWVMLTKIRS
jgi:hypothetical protein